MKNKFSYLHKTEESLLHAEEVLRSRGECWYRYNLVSSEKDGITLLRSIGFISLILPEKSIIHIDLSKPGEYTLDADRASVDEELKNWQPNVFKQIRLRKLTLVVADGQKSYLCIDAQEHEQLGMIMPLYGGERTSALGLRECAEAYMQAERERKMRRSW
jgi:hypothetical protein